MYSPLLWVIGFEGLVMVSFKRKKIVFLHHIARQFLHYITASNVLFLFLVVHLQNYLPQIIPQILKVFMHDNSVQRSVTTKVRQPMLINKHY